MVSCKLSYYFSSPVCLGLVGLVLARRANKMVIKSTTSCKIAPQNAGIIPVKAINSIKITIQIAVIISTCATFIVCLEIATASLTLEMSLI